MIILLIKGYLAVEWGLCCRLREVRNQESQVRTWDKLKSLVLDSLTSPHSRRAYGKALDHFHEWAARNSPEGFSKATVQHYRLALEQQGLAPSSINIRLSAIRPRSPRRGRSVRPRAPRRQQAYALTRTAKQFRF